MSRWRFTRTGVDVRLLVALVAVCLVVGYVTGHLGPVVAGVVISLVAWRISLRASNKR